MASHVGSGRSRVRQATGLKPRVRGLRASLGKGATAENWRHDNVGRLLNNAVRRFEARVIELMVKAGYLDTRASHFSLTRNLDRSGTRLTELAQRSVMTKQAMSELVDQCVALGLVERRPDPDDGRARIVMFTKEGLDWLEDCRRAIVLAECEMRREIGPPQLGNVKDALREYGISHEMLVRSE